VLREWWEKVSRVDASSSAGFFVAVLMACGLIVAAGVVMALLGGGFVPLAIAAVFVPALLFLALLHATALERGSRLVVARGKSTPYIPQHSNIQALVAKGQYAQAAEAYRQAIAAHPEDVVACEQLAQLALQELKDPEQALFALRAAEQRSPEPRRRAGFALLAANVYRDSLKDYGRTIVALRRVLSRYPDIPNAAALRAEIEELKVMHFQAR
jgi:tetratricopeptide (TPR) repeat protein